MIRIRNVISSGLLIEGRVVEVIANSEDVESVVFEFSSEGTTYQGRSVVGDMRRSRSFRKDETIDLFVDPANPRRAYPARIYLNDF